MQIKFTLNRILLFCLLIFPITTIFQGLPGLDPLNRLITVVIMVLMIAGLFLEKIHTFDIAYLIIGLMLSIICVAYTGKAYTSVTITSFIFWLVFLIYIANNYKTMMEEIVANINLLKGVTLFWEISVALSLFLPSSYAYEWGGRYFQSFSSGPHRFAMTCPVAIAYVFILLQLTKKPKYYLWLSVPLLGLLLCGARTYLMLGLFFCVAIYYIQCTNKKLFYSSLIPVMLLAGVIIMISPSGRKIQSTFAGNGYFGYWATLTNGRSMFWIEDIKGYWGLSFWKKMVGNGINYVYDLNYHARGGSRIWAHNDVLNLLCTNGLIGTILYFVVFFAFISRNKVSVSRGMFIPLFAFYFMLGFNAMFNMLYTYTAAVIGIPFMFFCLYTLPCELDKYRMLMNNSCKEQD